MLLNLALPHLDQEERHHIISLCALSLEKMNNVLCWSTQSSTIDYYLIEVADIALDYKNIDSLKEKHEIKAHGINNVINEVKYWQSMPNCIELVTIKMELRICKKYIGHHSDSLESMTCN